MTALVLAGGKATRYGGVDKRELRVADRTIFERQCAVLAPLAAEIIVSAPRPVAGFRTVADAVADAGPLAGIAAGLAAVATPWLLVVAGDMPHLDRGVLELLLAGAAADADAVGIRIAGLPEPLLCVLRVAAALPAVAGLLAARRLRASRLLTDAGLRVAWVEEAAVRAVDPQLRGLHNVNTPADLETR